VYICSLDLKRFRVRFLFSCCKEIHSYCCQILGVASGPNRSTFYFKQIFFSEKNNGMVNIITYLSKYVKSQRHNYLAKQSFRTNLSDTKKSVNFVSFTIASKIKDNFKVVSDLFKEDYFEVSNTKIISDLQIHPQN